MLLRRLAQMFSVLYPLVVVNAAEADWLVNGTSVCAASGIQAFPSSASDGSGGVLVAWSDARSPGDWNVFVQRMTRAGVNAPGWPANGVPACLASGAQGVTSGLCIGGDGAGGAFIAWGDRRGADVDVYAQHINALGAVSPGWPVDGYPVCVASGDQTIPVIATDGTGGLYVAWSDTRNGVNPQVFVQRVVNGPSISPGWPTNGKHIDGQAGDNRCPAIAANEAGVFVAWSEISRVALQHVTMQGTLFPSWPALGATVGPDSCGLGDVRAILDSSGGVFVTWAGQPASCGTLQFVGDIFAQRITALGQPAPGWPSAGVVVCNSSWTQSEPRAIANGSGGLLVTWCNEDVSDLNAQCLSSFAQTTVGWPQNPGTLVSTSPALKGCPDLASDGSGGAIITWYDEFGIYAQRVTGTGGIASGWPSQGLAVCTAPNLQDQPTIVSDGAGGALIAWRDARNSPPGQAVTDIYAQRIDGAGIIPTDAGFSDVAMPSGVGIPHPNPTLRMLHLGFDLPRAATIHASLYDVAGRKLLSLAPARISAGPSEVTWDIRAASGGDMPGGVYWLEVSWGGHVVRRRIVVSH